jgi:Cytochrome P460
MPHTPFGLARQPKRRIPFTASDRSIILRTATVEGEPIMNATAKYRAVIGVLAVAALFALSRPIQSAAGSKPSSTRPGAADANASPIYGVTIPVRFRQWELIAPSQEAGSLNELRAKLGNDVAMNAYRKGSLPFPDGTILAKVAWKCVPSAEYDAALGAQQGFVPGAATTLQFMVKDSKRYASTGGWGFGRFINNKPVNQAQHETCFACHAAHAKEHDFVFTQYAP